MSANKYDVHLVVIPEDDANRQIVTGFRKHLEVDARKIQVEPVAGGWLKVLDVLLSDHVAGMGKYARRHVLLLIDFDGDSGRFEEARGRIPASFRNRVFVMGCLSEPEALCSATSLSREDIGERLAEACMGSGFEDANGLWTHDALKHNQPELVRMKNTICQHLRVTPG